MSVDYGNTRYWDERYAADDSAHFDWYQSYETLKPHLEPYLRKDAEFEILIPGCGNSLLPVRLYEDGYLNISNIDTSSIVIKQMEDRYKEYSEMDFSVIDATSMSQDIPGDLFDLVIDKALTDAILCGDDSFRKVTQMMQEVYRVLKPGGVYIIISFGEPAARLGYLKGKSLDWKVEHKEIAKPPLEGFKEVGVSKVHHMYVCQKPEQGAGGSGAGAGAGAGATQYEDQ